MKLPNHFIFFPGLSQAASDLERLRSSPAAALDYLSVVVPGSCLTRARVMRLR